RWRRGDPAGGAARPGAHPADAAAQGAGPSYRGPGAGGPRLCARASTPVREAACAGGTRRAGHAACSIGSKAPATGATIAPHQSEHPPALLDPASPAMGELLAEAWRAGTLVLPLRDETSPVRLPGLHRSVLPSSLS